MGIARILGIRADFNIQTVEREDTENKGWENIYIPGYILTYRKKYAITLPLH